MDNYNLKRQLMGEIQEAIRVKELNVQLMEHLTFIADWILRYCERNNIKPPDIHKLSELITRAGNLVQQIYEPYSHLPTESQQRFKTPDGSTEQQMLTKKVNIPLTSVTSVNKRQSINTKSRNRGLLCRTLPDIS
jgi:hypothetical protein